MDVKQMIRLVIKVIGFIYWFVFLYLGGLIVVDWSGFMSQHNIDIALFCNNSVDALYHFTHLSSYCVDSSPNFAEQLMV